jgi:GNAT superfamily N-acetyltransferase
MYPATFTCRRARFDDSTALRKVIGEAISVLQRPFLDEDQVHASREIMGLDVQLISDGTYFVAETRDGLVAGCGGWSRRAALYGADHTPSRDLRMLDPTRDPARIRAIYTHPVFARQGIGRMILKRCEESAVAAGFNEAELLATLAGHELFKRSGYHVLEPAPEVRAGIMVPLLRMRKNLVASH